jgi:uncharacterized protein (DUF58 family)
MADNHQQFLTAGELAGGRYALGTPRRLPLGAAGTHQGGRSGSSLEFKEHRDYQPGDDLRHVDWNAYARSDQLVVKHFHEEVNPRLDVVLDCSRSMALPGSAKARAALGLTALFTTAADNAGFARAVWTTRGGFHLIAGSEGRPSGWEAISFEDRLDPAAALAQKPPAWRPRGIRVLLSDLLWMGDPLSFLAFMAERATAVIVVQILAQADLHPPERGGVRLTDMETEKIHELLIDDTVVRRYRTALERHQQQWHLACRQVGAVFTTVVAEQIVRDWRLHELVAAEVLKVI